MPTPTKGDWAKMYINGLALESNSGGVSFQHKKTAVALMAENVGVAQFGPGDYDPAMSLTGYRLASSPYAPTAHNLLAAGAAAGLGLAADLEYIISILLGSDAAPVAGDAALLMDATLLNYDPGQINQADWLKFVATLGPRGKLGGIGNLILDQPATTTGTITSPFFDRGAAAAAGTLLGAIGHLQVVTPSGVQALGTHTLSGLPADNDTVTIGDGVTTRVYRYKTVPALAGDILIGATINATLINLWEALIGSQTGKGVAYFTGTLPLYATMTVVKPPAGVITFTALAYGTSGNAFTLAKSGVNLAVSGATFASGAAGDSYVVTLQSATTSGGAYTAFMTFNSTLQTGPGGERQEILAASNVTINQFIKASAVTGGSTSKPALNMCFSPNWQN